MGYLDFNRDNWISYLARIKVEKDGLLSDEEQKAYDRFLMEEAYDEEERNIYHENLQTAIDLEIVRIADEEEEFEDLEMYKIYADKLNEVETIEEDEILNGELEW